MLCNIIEFIFKETKNSFWITHHSLTLKICIHVLRYLWKFKILSHFITHELVMVMLLVKTIIFNSLAPSGDTDLGQITGSGNGLLPDGTKPLPEPMFCGMHLKAILQELINNLNHYMNWKTILFNIISTSPRSQWVILTHKQRNSPTAGRRHFCDDLVNGYDTFNNLSHVHLLKTNNLLHAAICI